MLISYFGLGSGIGVDIAGVINGDAGVDGGSGAVLADAATSPLQQSEQRFRTTHL